MTPPLYSESSETSLLEINAVTLLRGTSKVFEALTLHLSEPRIGLIGDNGAGKSSLFRMICGLDKPESGTVRVRGFAAHDINTKRPGMVGMMFQNPDDQIIFPTVEEELALSLSPSGLPRRQAIAAIMAQSLTPSALEFLDDASLNLIRAKHPQLTPFQIKSVLWACAANVRRS